MVRTRLLVLVLLGIAAAAATTPGGADAADHDIHGSDVVFKVGSYSSGADLLHYDLESRDLVNLTDDEDREESPALAGPFVYFTNTTANGTDTFHRVDLRDGGEQALKPFGVMRGPVTDGVRGVVVGGEGEGACGMFTCSSVSRDLYTFDGANYDGLGAPLLGEPETTLTPTEGKCLEVQDYDGGDIVFSDAYESGVSGCGQPAHYVLTAGGSVITLPHIPLGEAQVSGGVVAWISWPTSYNEDGQLNLYDISDDSTEEIPLGPQARSVLDFRDGVLTLSIGDQTQIWAYSESSGIQQVTSAADNSEPHYIARRSGDWVVFRGLSSGRVHVRNMGTGETRQIYPVPFKPKPIGYEVPPKAAVILLQGLHSNSEFFDSARATPEANSLADPYRGSGVSDDFGRECAAYDEFSCNSSGELTEQGIEQLQYEKGEGDQGQHQFALLYDQLRDQGLRVINVPTENAIRTPLGDPGSPFVPREVSSLDDPLGQGRTTVAAWLRFLKEKAGVNEAVIVAHSMGGLLARSAQSSGNTGLQLKGIFTNATPHLGAAEATFCADEIACQRLYSASAMDAFNSTVRQSDRRSELLGVGGFGLVTPFPVGPPVGDLFVSANSACGVSVNPTRPNPSVSPCRTYFRAAHGYGEIAGFTPGRGETMTDRQDIRSFTEGEVLRILGHGPAATLGADGSRLADGHASRRRLSAQANEVDTESLAQLAPATPVDPGTVVVEADHVSGGVAELELQFDGSARTTQLRDDGVAPDDVANDGVVSSSVNLTPGEWLGTITAGNDEVAAYVGVRDPVLTQTGPASFEAIDQDEDGAAERYEMTLPVTAARAETFSVEATATPGSGDAAALGPVSVELAEGAGALRLPVPAKTLAATSGAVEVTDLVARTQAGSIALELESAGSFSPDPETLDVRAIEIGRDAGPASNEAAVTVDVRVWGDVDSVEVSANDSGNWVAVAELEELGPALHKASASIPGLEEGYNRILARPIRDGTTTGELAEVIVVVDRTAPVLKTLDAGTSEWSNQRQRQVHRQGPASEADLVFETRIDGGAITQSYGELDEVEFQDGAHTLEVRAIDQAGNVGPWKSATVQVDTVEPDTAIDSGPSGPTNAAAPAFTFSSPEPGASFQCRIGTEAEWQSCASTQSFNGLAQGAHSLWVRARDRAGNLDQSPATREFVVDTVAPSLGIDSGPNAPSTDASPVFGFHAEAGATLQCSLDRGSAPSWGSCSGATTHAPVAPLDDGSWVFRVHAADTAGNSAVATRDFAVDTTAPDARIVSAPSAVINSSQTSVSFTTAVAEPSAAFECRLDGVAFSSCSSPVSLTGLAEGAHVFEVRARDGLGNTDPSPAVAAFTVQTTLPPPLDRSAPETSITSKPRATVKAKKAAQVSFGFAAHEPGVTFVCALDRAPMQPCTTPVRFKAKPGRHSFAVAGIDAAGNRDQSPAAYSFNVKKKRK